jgi:hypothetical protein
MPQWLNSVTTDSHGLTPIEISPGAGSTKDLCELPLAWEHPARRLSVVLREDPWFSFSELVCGSLRPSAVPPTQFMR